jgi:hypothetical protein
MQLLRLWSHLQEGCQLSWLPCWPQSTNPLLLQLLSYSGCPQLEDNHYITSSSKLACRNFMLQVTALQQLVAQYRQLTRQWHPTAAAMGVGVGVEAVPSTSTAQHPAHPLT